MPVLSLVVSIFLLTLIGNDIKKITTGNETSFTKWAILIEALLLFILPFLFNPQIVSRRLERIHIARAQKKKHALDLKIEKQIRFNVEYRPSLVVRCPRCGFESPTGAKTCFNCGFKLNF
ncbi:MAG: zinc ribbon domain-containing protein [Candidatus Lokiarchaeota archaeon]|nr:zinc ribbon domain-containing protein [Candidatus Harpocratesius repetitus]